MTNKVIRLIRPVENGAEKEYIKEFFRFIGCFFSDKTIDPRSPNDWLPYLRPDNESGNIEILVNYFGEDPYLQECRIQGITRIYCYLSFERMYESVNTTPLPSEKFLPIIPGITKATLRKAALFDMIALIWKSEPVVEAAVQNIATLYTNNPRGDLFHYLQIKRSLQFLSMADVLSEPSARVPYIRLYSYLQQAIEAIWFVYLSLEACSDPYSQYSRIKAANMIYSVYHKIEPCDRQRLLRISFPFFRTPFHVASLEEMIDMLRNLIGKHPDFWSAHLRMAAMYRGIPNADRSEELCYLKVLQSIPKEQRDYAFIWHRCGYFFEKKYKDIEKAKVFYQTAVRADPEYYQSLFKLGYFAASEGRLEDAESLLNQTIKSIFCGRSTEPDADGRYQNWLALSLKDSQYVFKAYILLAKISIKRNQEHSAKFFVGKACLAATRFESAGLVLYASNPDEADAFNAYHGYGEPVWAIWHVLKPWSNSIVQDAFVNNIVLSRLRKWPDDFIRR